MYIKESSLSFGNFNNMNKGPSQEIPVIVSDDIKNEHPLTTEEPLNSPELEKEIESINSVNPEDDEVPPAVILDKDEPNKLIGTHTIIDDNDDDDENEEDKPEIIIDGLTTKKRSSPTSPVSKTLSNFAPATTSITTTTVTGALDISPINNLTKEDSDSDDTDEELARITEANRFIPIDKKTDEDKDTNGTRRKSLRSQSVAVRKDLLVFAKNSTTTKKSDRIIVQQRYGAGISGKLDQDYQSKRRSRGYLVACDFSEESFHAIEWTMGTMMRDGDTLYVVTVVNREDNPDAVKETGLSLSKEVNI